MMAIERVCETLTSSFKMLQMRVEAACTHTHTCAQQSDADSRIAERKRFQGAASQALTRLASGDGRLAKIVAGKSGDGAIRGAGSGVGEGSAGSGSGSDGGEEMDESARILAALDVVLQQAATAPADDGSQGGAGAGDEDGVGAYFRGKADGLRLRLLQDFQGHRVRQVRFFSRPVCICDYLLFFCSRP